MPRRFPTHSSSNKTTGIILTATNQVSRAYSGFGQLTAEWQSHTGVVDYGTTPKVQYTYSEGIGGNHSRLTKLTYPSGYEVNSWYIGTTESAMSRPSSLTGLRAGSSSAVTLEFFKYLGASTVVERHRSEVNVGLVMAPGGTTGDAGDQYTGLDRFGRIADQQWRQGATIVDQYGSTYDRNSNRLTSTNGLNAAFNEVFTYDALNQIESYTRGAPAAPTMTQDWQFDALGNWTGLTNNGVAQARTANAQNEVTQVGGSTIVCAFPRLACARLSQAHNGDLQKLCCTTCLRSSSCRHPASRASRPREHRCRLAT